MGFNLSRYLKLGAAMPEKVVRSDGYNLEVIILKLLLEKSSISISDVALEAGLSKSNERDRKRIRRILLRFVKQGSLEPVGSGRARRYVVITSNAAETTSVEIETTKSIREIPLSQEGEKI